MSAPHPATDAAGAVPPLDADLEDLLDGIRGVHPDLDEIADRFHHLLLDRHTLDTSQSLIAALGGWERHNMVALIGLAIQRLATPDSNPCLRALPEHRQKLAQRIGENTAFFLTGPNLAQLAADTAAVIDG